MNQQQNTTTRSSSQPLRDQNKQDKIQMIDNLKAPIIERGRSFGYEVVENYDLGAGPIHVTWIFKPGGSESLPDIRLGFICITEFSQSSLNEAIARAMLNLIDKLILVVPTEEMTKPIKDSIESMPQNSILQLRKYITVLTPGTLVSKAGIEGSKEHDSSQTGEMI